MITYTWTIANCNFEVATGAITQIHWIAKATEGDRKASTYGSFNLTPDPDDPAFVSYENVTEAMMQEWIASIKPDVEARLATKITEQETPTEGSGVLPWEASATNMKAKGETVTHDGKTWESLIDRNVWEPPVGWREVVAQGYPEWIQPTGAHDAYNTGDRVTFEGADYESTIDANTWSPTEYPAGWSQL